MTKDETGKLFMLLRQFYPNKNITAQLRLAWELVLEPYSYADVKAAAVAYVRKNKFFPDVSDLTAGLSESVPALHGRDRLNAPAPWMLPFVKELEAENETSVSRRARQSGMRWEDARRETEQGKERKEAEEERG